MAMTPIWTEDCVLCHRREASPCAQVCTSCRGRLRSDLADIPKLYADLTRELIPGSSNGPRITGTRERPIPATLDVLNLRSRSGSGVISRWLLEERGAPTEHLADQHGSIPIAGVLAALESDVRESFGFSVAVFHGNVEQTVTAIVSWLLKVLDSICDAYPAVEEFVADLRSLHAECRRLMGLTPRRFAIGACPMVLTDDSVCGTARSIDPYGDAMRCSGCGTTWHRWEWMQLAVAIVEGDAA